MTSGWKEAGNVPEEATRFSNGGCFARNPRTADLKERALDEATGAAATLFTRMQRASVVEISTQGKRPCEADCEGESLGGLWFMGPRPDSLESHSQG